MSTKPPLPERDVDPITAAADAAIKIAAEFTPEERIAILESRVASIEPLLEQLQAQSALGVKIEKYVQSLQGEQSFFNAARWVLGVVWLAIIIFLFWLLRDAVYNPVSPLLRLPPIAIATFVIGLISGIVLLLSAFVKGVFRTTAERHADGFMPPALNAALEAYQKIIGKQN